MGLLEFVSVNEHPKNRLSMLELESAMSDLWSSIDPDSSTILVTPETYHRMRLSYRRYLRRHPRLRFGWRVTVNRRVLR